MFYSAFKKLKMNSYPWEGFVLLDNAKFTFHELEDTFKTFEKKIVLTMNQEKARNLTLYLSNPDLRNSLITKIRFFYLNQEKTGELNHNSIIQDIYQEVIKWIAVCIDNKEDGIINTDQEEIYDESKALPKNTKNTNLKINIHQKECWEMKAGVKKYDQPVSVGKNSKENIQSSNTLQNYQPMQHMQHMQQLMTDISNCKSNVDLNQSIPKSVLVVYFILSTLTINEAEASKLRTFFTLKYLTKHDKDADDNFLQISHEEKIPGPIAFSVKLRPALKYLGTKLLKIFVEKQTMKCPNNLWTTKAGFYLYDHSTEKIYSCTYKSIEIEALIDILIVCCQKKSFDITNLKEQVLAWTSCKFDRLIFLHYISIISLHLSRTTQHAERDAVDKKMEKLGVKLDYTTFQNWLSNSPVIQNRKKADLSWEACLCIVSILCEHVIKEFKMGEHGFPLDWSAEYEKFQKPYNKKGPDHDIKKFFKDLLDYCSKRHQGNWILQEFKSYITACEAWIKDPKQQKDLLQEYVLHHDVTVIKEKLRFLQSVCSAQSLCNVKSMLGERGIYLLSDTGRTVSLQSDPAFTLMKRKYKNLETTEKKYVKMPRYNAEISGLETAQKPMAILKASDAKVSPKERKLRTKTEMGIIFDDELCKVITHGYKPDFSKFQEVPYPNVQKKQEQESSEESKYEHQHEHGMLIENIGDEPEEKTNSDISNPRDTCITKENKDCEYTFENCATCGESENYLGKIPELENFAEISTIKPVNTSTLEMTSGISSPGQAEIEENSSNIASNNNYLNYEYHDDNISDNTFMNIDSTNDGMDDGIYLSTETVTRGSSSAISDQSNVILDIDF